MEDLERQHELELLDLQQAIEKLTLTFGKKSDKNQKRALNNKVEKLKRDLEIKQEEERYQLSLKTMVQESSEDEEVEVPKEKIPEKVLSTKSASSGNKKNRQQVRKERKAAELEKLMLEAEKEAQNLPKLRENEIEAINTIINDKKLKLHTIQPDGHCLYNAFRDQLSILHNVQVSLEDVRDKASQFIRENKDDFLPFLSSDNGIMSQDAFESYCDEIKNTATWGGQPEIVALSKAFNVPITIIKAEGPNVEIGDEFKEILSLKLSYHQHEYGLGAHYNSLRPS